MEILKNKDGAGSITMVVGPSKHKVWCLCELWSDKSTCTNTYYETSFRMVEVTTTKIDEALLYTDGHRFFVVQKTGSYNSEEAVPNCAGWKYQGGGNDTHVRQKLYEIADEMDTEALRNHVQKDLQPCAAHYGSNTQALFEEYFAKADSKAYDGR